jgi:hypothetical protein
MPSDIIVIERELLKSKAFRELNGTAKNVYFDFRMKCRVKGMKRSGRKKEHVILNNGQLEYCYSEAETKGITRPSFVTALDALVRRGFIDIEKQGEGGRKGDKSLYAISERWRKWGTDEFEYAERRKDLRQGRGFAAYWKKRKHR